MEGELPQEGDKHIKWLTRPRSEATTLVEPVEIPGGGSCVELLDTERVVRVGSCDVGDDLLS